MRARVKYVVHFRFGALKAKSRFDKNKVCIDVKNDEHFGKSIDKVLASTKAQGWRVQEIEVLHDEQGS